MPKNMFVLCDQDPSWDDATVTIDGVEGTIRLSHVYEEELIYGSQGMMLPVRTFGQTETTVMVILETENPESRTRPYKVPLDQVRSADEIDDNCGCMPTSRSSVSV